MSHCFFVDWWRHVTRFGRVALHEPGEDFGLRLLFKSDLWILAKLMWYSIGLYVSLEPESCFMLIRPPVRSNGRTYKMLVMFLFFPTRNLRDPSADHRETLLHDWKLVLYYNPTFKILGALPQKNLGAKNMQNFGPFYTTSDFDREYLRNGLRYPKSES